MLNWLNQHEGADIYVCVGGLKCGGVLRGGGPPFPFSDGPMLSGSG